MTEKHNKKLLFIDKNPYGILIDTYKYCQYLQRDYDITYVCIDYGYPKIDSGSVKVRYVPFTRYRWLRGGMFFIVSLFYVLIFKGFIFVSYYPGCGILKTIAYWKKIHVDIRTLSVSPKYEVREKWNRILTRNIKKFDSISVISEGVKKKLNISGEKVYIVPLGADVISSSHKSFDKLRLLYVGTLNNRRILDTVIGFHNFVKMHACVDAHYIIIGDGEEIKGIRQYVTDNRLESMVEIKGRIPYTKLKPYFDSCNIGVSYIPITDYYQYQPPTKTYEYIMSGLFCLATSTIENKKIIKKENGLLHDDSSLAFYKAMEFAYLNKNSIDSRKIQQSLIGNTWNEIVEKSLIPLLESINK